MSVDQLGIQFSSARGTSVYHEISMYPEICNCPPAAGMLRRGCVTPRNERRKFRPSAWEVAGQT